MVINEVIDLAKRRKRECLILKVNFEKEYDSADYGFLEYMMRRMILYEKCVKWMKACVCGGNVSILVNGISTEEVSIKKGLKQGDPLAHFFAFVGGRRF